MESLIATWQRVRAIPPFWWDVALAAAVTVFAQASGDFRGDEWNRLAALLLTAPLAWRRRYPLVAFCTVAFFALLAGHDAPAAAVVVAVIASYSVGQYSRHVWISLVAVLFTATLILTIYGGGLPPLPDIISPYVIVVPFWLAGNALRIRQLRADVAEARARQLEQQQEQGRQAAILEERGRIARELHDVVAHSVSVMVVQAGAAREVLKSAPATPPEAVQSLLSVEASGREALAELRHMLGALSNDGAGATATVGAPVVPDAGIAPQPGLDQLDTLVQRVRDAGLPVSVKVMGEQRSLPAGADIAAYRIVQEALTNALKYAKGAQTEVTLDYRERDVKIEVLDSGPGVAPNGDAPGRGLAGMRERVAVFGGKLEAGPRLERGYAVRAWLPLTADPQ